MKLKYQEGSTFLVPLKDGGFARGVVARVAPKGKIAFGYFFAPRLPTSEGVDFDAIKPEDASLTIFFGDLGLIKGHWPIVGKMAGWDRAQWPLQDTVRRDPLGKLRPMLVRYDDSDPSKVLRETAIDNDSGLPDDGLAGYRYVEARLSKLLA